MYLMEGERGLNGMLEYSTALFDKATITRIARHYRTLVEGIVGNPDQRVFDLPLLTAGEQEQLLVQWNRTEAEYPREKCLHELFEEQVERTPGQ